LAYPISSLEFLYELLKNAQDILFKLFFGHFGKGPCRPLAGNHEYPIGSEIGEIPLQVSDETRKPGSILPLKTIQTLDDPFPGSGQLARMSKM
jgi:hypothetical protein